MSNTSEEKSQFHITHMAVVSKSESGSALMTKKRRNPPGNPDPNAEVVALSPRALLATNRYICEVCHKGFQRDQNLQLHRRGHNLPWKLKQRSNSEAKKRVFVCPELTCAHHDPTRALGDLTGIKKHYSRKHGEKKWKCDKCTKRYAVLSDWKTHSKICGTKEYRCYCGTIFSRKDSFITHRAFCEALTEENYQTNQGQATMVGNLYSQSQNMLSHTLPCQSSSITVTTTNMSYSDLNTNNPLRPFSHNPLMLPSSDMLFNNSNLGMSMGSSFMSVSALLQKAADIGAKARDESVSPIFFRGFAGFSNNTRPSGSLADTAEVSSEVGYERSFRPAAGSSYMGIQSSLQMSSKTAVDASGNRTRSFVPFPLGGEKIADGRMTRDLLGLGASGSTSVGSSGNQDYLENEMYPYHQMW